MTVAMARTNVNRVLEPIRAGEWWDHKLAPMLGTGYMTAFHLRSSLLDLWPTFVATLVGMAAAAAYVSIINDLADLDDDAAAGKYNRLAGRRRRKAYVALIGVLTVGVAVAAIAWRDNALALGLYAGPWVAFSLYSLPPIRLKARAAAGALADASGAHLFPQLLITVVVFHALDRQLDATWFAVVGIWALAAGIRGALWHQLGDVEADSRSGVNTYGRLDPARARLAGRSAFAIELVAFFFLLWRAGSPLAFALLVPYLLLELARVHVLGVRLIVVSRVPSFRIVAHDYYLFFYPLAFLIASTIRHSEDTIVLVVHTALFSGILLVLSRDSRAVFRRLAVDLRTAAAPPGRTPS